MDRLYKRIGTSRPGCDLDFNDEQWQRWALWMRLVQDGDTEAYARLLSEISPLIFNYVRKRVFNPSYVEDIYQEVLLSFHKARHTYRVDRPFSPWLFAVVRNALWNTLNKNRRFLEKEVLLADLPETPWSATEDLEMDERLNAALDSLPKENRQAVEMLKLKDMSVENAAKELGISKVAFKVRAHRGYLQLRQFLSKEGPHAG